MFTNADFKDYFTEIDRLEKEMVHLQMATMTKVHNPELISMLGAIVRDEVRHLGLTAELLAMLDTDTEK